LTLKERNNPEIKEIGQVSFAATLKISCHRGKRGKTHWDSQVFFVKKILASIEDKG